jgi:hypothetical protein
VNEVPCGMGEIFDYDGAIKALCFATHKTVAGHAPCEKWNVAYIFALWFTLIK